MELRIVLVTLSLLCSAAADEGSCVGRCGLGFQLEMKCQCFALCSYYSSCCRDYHSVCEKAPGEDLLFLDDKVDGGFPNGTDYYSDPDWGYWDYEQNDTDSYPEPNGTDIYPEPEPDPITEPDPSVEPDPITEPDPGVEPDPIAEPDPSVKPEPITEPDPSVEPEPSPEPDPSVEPKPSPEPDPSVKPEPSLEPDPSVEPQPRPEPTNVCTSKKPFDAITELQNASMVAFVGKYLYKLTVTGVADGYPKLIEDVWGVQGPIDAAFTRINCEGKTYLFKGEFYWRFHNGIMEAGFPKLIRDGFPQIPDNVDAALALPAPGICGKEQVYFFKGRSYWKYVFRSQPSQEECARASISVPFRRYIHFLHLDWEQDFFTELFGSPGRDGTFGPYPIGRHWRGLPTRVDSAVIGKHSAVRKLIARHHGKRPHRCSGEKRHPHSGEKGGRRSGEKQHRRSRGKGHKRVGKKWHPHSGKRWPNSSREKHHSSDDEDSFIFAPSQSVYFFSGGDYYRVVLETKRVAFARPPYPRSIAKDWFKCKDVSE